MIYSDSIPSLECHHIKSVQPKVDIRIRVEQYFSTDDEYKDAYLLCILYQHAIRKQTFLVALKCCMVFNGLECKI
jgi:hypothetical protein